MRSPPTRVAVALAATVAVAMIVIVASGAVPPLSSDESPAQPDRPDDPTTEGTVGYVEGYWADDDLPVDESDDAVVEDDELEAVVYRSMARVEEIRNATFEADVPVEVISREEFQEDHGDVFVSLTEEERVANNVTYEALFMVDRETDATAELESMYGGTVEGYYVDGRIVIVSETPENPELNEVVLGHELVHALQDQRFGLRSFERGTIDQENAVNGLVEGDAARVDVEYERRCGDEWDCLRPGDAQSDGPTQLNWGIYLTLYQPYSDGPDYVDSLREAGDGWAAVDAAYDEPPPSSSTVIHHEEREPADVSVPDRSSDAWERLEINGTVATERAGEAAMVAMFAADSLASRDSSVIDRDALLGDDPTTYDYDQPYTNGWAGDELVTYVDADAGANATAADAGYVWQTEWRSSDHARQFASGYLELLEGHDAEAVDDRRDTYVIDDEFPGAYAIERDGETVTIVRAPTVEQLDGIRDGAAPEGEDTIERVNVSDDDDDANAAVNDDVNDDTIAGGFAAPGAGAAVAIVVTAVVVRARAAADWEPGSETAAPDPGALGCDRGRA
ncbi:Hvo_1808 family surface protein [Haloterrigena alkaliphila]|uniref:Hvo_1808 family surface protein n=1 Tax=Haloterrigena alkaliphila TaxID=2816475 RepID=A0A8A2VHI1_9EURY|nr:Hvo_1808 family surface protein [Haloterrigena alkaliphila]QSX00982.1 Hvo_1808 family surface protein [Haloterrigena alkaliphila]